MKPDDSSASHRKLRRIFNDAGHAHALTFSCFRRQTFLRSQLACRWALEAIDRARTRHEFHLWAYVLMPEHVHLVIWPTRRSYSISAILNSMKQSVAKTALIYVRKNAPDRLSLMEDRRPDGTNAYRFWQRGGGYDRNLIEPRTVHAEIAYVHANPVRRGLCEREEDWRWSSAAEYATPGSGPLSIDFDSLPSVG